MFLIDNINKTGLVVNLLIAAILLYLFRTAVPFFKYPFIILYFGFFVYCHIKYMARIKSSLKDLLPNYGIILLLIAILILSFLISNKIYLLIFKDVVNTIILISIFYLLNIVITTRNTLNVFIISLIKLILVFGLIVSILEFIRFYFLIKGVKPIFNLIVAEPTNGTSLHIDYNFALLPIFYGLIGVFYLMNKSHSTIQKIIYNVLLVTFTFNIFLSSSRRGLIIFLAGILFLFVIQIITFFKKSNYFKKLSEASRYYLLSVFTITLISYFIIFQTSYEFKNNCLEFIGVKNIHIAKNEIASIFYRHISLINNKYSFTNIHNKLWSHSFDPINPDSGWGVRNHITIYPLYGNNVQIVPKGSKGYLIDKTCEVTTWSGHAFSITNIGNAKVFKGDSIFFSAYCFVSENFNGTWAQISYKGEEISTKRKRYNFNTKGTWQKLSINQVLTKEGVIYFYLYFSLYNITNFNNLDGYVIFAHPQFEIIRAEDNIESYTIPYNIYHRRDILNANNVLALYPSRLKNLGNNNELENKNSYDKTKLNMYKPMLGLNNSGGLQYYKESLFNIMLGHLIPQLVTTNDRDPIRRWVANLISEDTTYYGYKAVIKIDSITNRFIGERVERWLFSWQLFTREYTWMRKLFGGGFAHLNWYGFYFSGDKTRSDYPHNPFLSVLLYSGIFGLIIYIFFMYKVVCYYFRYFREYTILFIYFIFTFFFTFFSGGSPFDPPMMGFFVILPFFIHSLHKKEKSG